MTCWVWIESGECVDAATHEEAVALLQYLNQSEVVKAEDVVDEPTAQEMLSAFRWRVEQLHVALEKLRSLE